LVDGHRINDNVYDQGLLGTEFPIDVDLIERVEIVRGPSSSLYGTNAFFAVINIVTKRGRNLKGPEVSPEGAGFGTYKGRLSYGKEFGNGLELLLSGSYYNSRGQRRLYFKEFDDPATNHGLAENADTDRSTSLFANLSYRDFTARGVYGSREKRLPTASYGTVFNDPRNRTSDRRGYLDLRYEHTLRNRLQLMVRVYGDSYNYDGYYIYDASTDGTPLLVENRDLLRGAWLGGEVQLTKVVASRHKLTFGAEYQDNLRQHQSNYDLDPAFMYVDSRQRSNNAGLYFQDEFALHEKVTLNIGGRHDHYTAFGGIAKPRLGLIYHPSPTTALKFLYGEAFRAPNNYERYYVLSTLYKPNADLKPETIKTGEMVMEQYLGDHLRLSASGYLYRINGLISQQFDPADGLITFTNAEKIESKGLDLEAETKLVNGLEAHLGYTLQSTRDRRTNEPLSNSPRHLGKLNLSLPLIRRRMFASLGLQYTSRRRTLAGTDTEAFWIPNLTLFSQRLIRGLDLSFGVYNLFDRKYGDPGSAEHRQTTIEQNGRNFRIKLTLKLGGG
ncbi:MAG TPA: TonB-dependent receptor, partial [Blastocatellia bacterium]|nr:TonB-dependent receptor [Blastocatellia bacterium]